MSIPDHILLRVHDLSIGFRAGDQVKVAVSGISFDIEKGKTLGIVGESGSGKSVSSLSLMRLLHKDKAVFLGGEVFIHLDMLKNQELDPARCMQSHYKCAPDDPIFAHLRGHAIAMIFQEPMTALNPVMRCGDQIMEMWRGHAHIGKQEARQRTLTLFQDVLLPTPDQMMERYPHELSGGQRQRVMIAMAMACQPQLIIADEPTTALDVTVQKEILELLKRLQKQRGMAMVFITHDLGVVSHMADDVVVMRRGRVVESGKADQVLNAPREIYTQALLACRPQWGKKWKRLPTIADMESQTARMEEQSIGQYEQPLLRVVDLTKTFVSRQGFLGQLKTEFQAVKQVTFDIMQGETLGLVGESGCGKTTLSRMLLGLIPATSGSVWYDGQDLMAASKAQWREVRKDLQIIFQDPYSALNPKISVGDAILEPMVVRGFHGQSAGREREMRALLDKVGLPSDAAGKYPHEFSGGQRQRIVIARALATQPKWIICDESVSALDVSVQAQVLNLLNDLKRDFGLTYLFISHDLSVIYQMCDRIMVMQKGAIQELDRADRVFFSPQSEYTQRLLQATMSV
jgi:peptide/nickel transport system ATP-binding protein